MSLKGVINTRENILADERKLMRSLFMTHQLNRTERKGMDMETEEIKRAS